ncbi:MAG: hypothetical protein KJ645_10605 [Planctomycetes bacterium]|nr:hypothetical protein [Planctomycetota bacterium]
MILNRILIVPATVLVLFFMAGCAAVKTEPAEKPSKATENSDARKKTEMERKLVLAEKKLEVAKESLALQEISSMNAKTFAEYDLKMAETNLEQFEKIDGPNKIAKAELSLQRSIDAAQEAEEELKQLEIMYKDQDLEDMTAEFVINRGKRRSERTQAQLAIEREELRSLTEYEVPRELKMKAQEVEKKKTALAEAERSAANTLLQKNIAVMEAEAAIVAIKDELAELMDKEASK